MREGEQRIRDLKIWGENEQAVGGRGGKGQRSKSRAHLRIAVRRTCDWVRGHWLNLHWRPNEGEVWGGVSGHQRPLVDASSILCCVSSFSAVRTVSRVEQGVGGCKREWAGRGESGKGADEHGGTTWPRQQGWGRTQWLGDLGGGIKALLGEEGGEGEMWRKIWEEQSWEPSPVWQLLEGSERGRSGAGGLGDEGERAAATPETGEVGRDRNRNAQRWIVWRIRVRELSVPSCSMF
jgi:hypothetical protein